ncbi:thiosulfate sulfurtransferase ['Osedax' symbiont bacterium Rs2_46_30_T18]|nr:thiosulfate sulfurtransferase ['Osedax' symbiont bacterium Rs2_46_30_T18]
MSEYQCISCQQAQQLLSNNATLFDIRDTGSFENGHPSQAKNLNNDNIQQLLTGIDKDQNLLILCYHGNSSKSAAQYISSLGFTAVASIDGGFEAWQSLFPEDIEATK